MSEVTFTEWLADFSSSDSRLGDLARDAAEDPNWPSDGPLARYRNHLHDSHACEGALETLDLAWQAYEVVGNWPVDS